VTSVGTNYHLFQRILARANDCGFVARFVVYSTGSKWWADLAADIGSLQMVRGWEERSECTVGASIGDSFEAYNVA
jgi:hypothetical protein